VAERGSGGVEKDAECTGTPEGVALDDGVHRAVGIEPESGKAIENRVQADA
jgi:hypothetical protein